jgi:hypothetical protein
MLKVVDRPLVKIRAAGIPLPESFGIANEVGSWVETHPREFSIPKDITPLLSGPMPKVQHASWDDSDSCANLRIDGFGPTHEVRVVLFISSEHSREAGGVPIAGECMGHDMISTAGDAGVIEAVGLEHFPPRCPGKACMAVAIKVPSQ